MTDNQNSIKHRNRNSDMTAEDFQHICMYIAKNSAWSDYKKKLMTYIATELFVNKTEPKTLAKLLGVKTMTVHQRYSQFLRNIGIALRDESKMKFLENYKNDSYKPVDISDFDISVHQMFGKGYISL